MGLSAFGQALFLGGVHLLGSAFASANWQALELGIQLLALRQQLLSNNVANANTPGFKRSDLPFEQIMQRVLSERRAIRPEEIRTWVVQDRTTSLKADGNNVDIELEMVRLTENNLTYQAAIRQLNYQFNNLRMAISEGRKG